MTLCSQSTVLLTASRSGKNAFRPLELVQKGQRRRTNELVAVKLKHLSTVGNDYSGRPLYRTASTGSRHNIRYLRACRLPFSSQLTRSFNSAEGLTSIKAQCDPGGNKMGCKIVRASHRACISLTVLAGRWLKL